MQGAIENFFKVFDEARRQYANIKYELTYETIWRMQMTCNGKLVFDLRQLDTNMLFDNAAHKLLAYIRGEN